MGVTADRDRCIGAGQCPLSAPEVFDSDDDGLVVVLRPDRDGEDVRQAVRACPVNAITATGA